MPKLPVVSGEEAKRAFEKAGWKVRTTTKKKGSHLWILKKEGFPHHLTIFRTREMKKGTLRDLIRDASLTVDEFVRLLRSH